MSTVPRYPRKAKVVTNQLAETRSDQATLTSFFRWSRSLVPNSVKLPANDVIAHTHATRSVAIVRTTVHALVGGVRTSTGSENGMARRNQRAPASPANASGAGDSSPASSAEPIPSIHVR